MPKTKFGKASPIKHAKLLPQKKKKKKNQKSNWDSGKIETKRMGPVS